MFGKYIRYLVVTLVVFLLTATSAIAQARTVTLTADRTTVSPGQCTNINLHISGKWSYILSPDNNRNISNQNNSTDFSVSWNVCPASTTTYYVVVSGSSGMQRPSITINVSAPPAPPQQPPSQANQFTFTADQTTVNPGQCTTLRWHTVNGVFVNYNNAQSWETVPGFDNTQVANGSQQVCPTSTTTYNLYVRFADGSRQSQSVTVNVSVPQPPPQPQQQLQPQQSQPVQPPAAANVPLSVNFYANPDTITAGQCTTLYWHVVGNNPAEKPGASIGPPTEDYGSVAPVPDGSGKVCPNSTTTYTLYGDDVNGNPWERKVTITVVQSGPAQPQIQPQPVQPSGASSGAMLDLESYCVRKYGNSASAKMGDRRDAWSWSCTTSNQQSYGIDMSDVCAVQHPDLPKAVMLDRWDAFSWVCQANSVQQPSAPPAVQPMAVQSEHGSLSELTDLNDSYHFTQAEYETIKNLLLTAPDSKACVEIIGTMIAGEVDFDTALHAVDTVNSCSTGLNEVNGILEKYLHHDEPNMLPMNLDGYCSLFYKGNIVAPDRNKPYDWKCVTQTSTVALDGTKMADVCQAQHPMHPDAVLLDNNDAYSWVCIRKSWIVGQN